MAVNESKISPDSPSWAKWKASGAIGNMLTAVTRPIKDKGKRIENMGIALNPDGTPKQTTLSIGLNGTTHEVYVVVPGEPFRLGQKVRAKDLPQGTQTVEQVYGPKKK